MSILYHHVSVCRRFVSLQKLFTSAICTINNVRRNCTNANASAGVNLVGSKLKSRSLIKVSGIDSRLFLQGIITNDIDHLETQPSIYTLFLNHQGRLLYDAILYSTERPETTLIECDASIKSKLIKYLNVYRIRKKVEISDADNSSSSNELKQDVWVIFDSTLKDNVTCKYLVNSSDDNCKSSEEDGANPESSHKFSNRKIEQEVCCRPAYNHISKQHKLVLGNGTLNGIVDPRLPELGFRVLVPHHRDSPSSSSNGLPKDVQIKILPESEYTALRYALGVGEGVSDLPPANCFPLESNGDYLHGISFQKGCYIGQELTARTHHTGVVRKRLMPFIFSSPSPGNPTSITPEQNQLHGKEGKPVGKVRGIQNAHGLALVRISDALSSPEIKLGEQLVKVSKPNWWTEKKSQFG